MPNAQNDKKVSASDIERFLKGIRYPASKDKVLTQAKTNKAPEIVMEMLNKFEATEYKGPIDISKEIKRSQEE